MLSSVPLSLMQLLFGYPTLAVAALSLSIVTRLGGVAYYMYQIPEDEIKVDIHHVAEPATVFHVDPCAHVTRPWLEDTISRFADEDDVWSELFLENVIFRYFGEEPVLTKEAQDVCDEWGTKRMYFVRQNASNVGEGPYFLHMGKVYPAYRLYPDTSGAFMVGTVPLEEPLHYKAIDASAYGEKHPNTLSIPVPSRLHFPRTTDLPYAGLRIAIKDIIDLAGLKTGASSRAYTQLYAPRRKSARVVEKLLKLGFVAVGKVKTTQFADSEWPTCDWVDYHAPFNPRADGYQTTSGSSAGSVAAVASYEWLDFALGTDTLGSIRAPATVQGIYGMRSSLGAASFEGVIPYSPYFDTIGAFARDAPSYATIARAMYGSFDQPKCTQKPSKLVYLTDYWPVKDVQSQAVFENYISKLEEYLGIKRTVVNLEDLWQSTNPLKTTQKLQDYLEHVFEWVASPDQYTSFFKEFLEEYEEMYGHQPVLNPQLQFKRDWLPTTLNPDHQAAGLEAMQVFADWYEENIVPPAKNGCTDTLLVLPWSSGEPEYRDRYRESAQKFTGIGFFFYNISPYAKSPELIVPAGYTTYISRLTAQEQRLPAALGIIGGRGSDVMLADFVADFVKSAPVEDYGLKADEGKPVSLVNGHGRQQVMNAEL